MSADRFWERPVETLNREQWEALCDGCGKCCLHKLEDDAMGDVYHTNVACRLLDLRTGQCSDYKHRRAYVPDCLRLTPKLARELPWLPDTCAYRLRADGEPLPDWHYLISGDRTSVHAAGQSVIGKAISETMAGPLEEHIVPSSHFDGPDSDGDDLFDA
ncbi:MAG: YcgN family cysteine cluster protein [Novosphingobium sp.]